MCKNILRKLIPLIAVMIAIPGFLEAAERPNVVILFADDMGYGDLGSYGHPRINPPISIKWLKKGCG